MIKYTKWIEVRFEPSDNELVEKIAHKKDLKKGQLIREYAKRGIREDIRNGVI